MNQEERFDLDDERDRIARIPLTPEMYRAFEAHYKLSKVVTGQRRVLYDPKNTVKYRNFIEDNLSSDVWLLGDKRKPEFMFEITIHVFDDEAYNHFVAHLHDKPVDSLDEHTILLMDDPNVCAIERL